MSTEEGIAISKDWTTTTFGYLNMHAAASLNPLSYPDEVFELYSVPAFSDDKPEVISGRDIKSSKQVVQENDILVCKINPRINRVWKVAKKTRYRQIASPEWIIFRCPLVDPDFYTFYFKSPEFRQLLCDEVSGVGGSLTRTPPRKVAQFLVPLPPLLDQKAIAEKLHALFMEIDKVRTILEKIPEYIDVSRNEVLSQTNLKKLKEKSNVEGTQRWQIKTLGSIGEVGGGVTKNSSRENLPLKVPYLRVANVQSNRLNLSDVSEIGVTNDEFERIKLQLNDLLIVEGNGSINNIGRVSIWNGEVENCVHQNHLIRWRSLEANPKFVMYYLMSPDGRAAITDRATTTTGLYTLSMSKISSISIPLPSFEEQDAIVERISLLLELLHKTEEKHSVASVELNSLTIRVLEKAFQGRLVKLGDSDDDSQEVLEGIRLMREENLVSKNPVKKPLRVKNTVISPVSDANELLQTLKRIGGISTPENLLMESHLTENIELFFDLLRENKNNNKIDVTFNDFEHKIVLGEL